MLSEKVRAERIKHKLMAQLTVEERKKQEKADEMSRRQIIQNAALDQGNFELFQKAIELDKAHIGAMLDK